MRFLLLALVAVSTLCGGEPPAAPAIEADLWSMVPEQWRPAKDPVDGGDDAGPLIRAAGAHVQAPSVDDEPLWRIYHDGSSWRKPWPAGESAAPLLAWMDAPDRSGAMAVLDQALALGHRRPAPRNGSDPVMGAGRDLMRFLVLRCRRAIAAGDCERSEAELRRISGLCRIMRGGPGGLGLLVDISLAAQAVDAVVGVAVRASPDPAATGRLRQLIPPAIELAGDVLPRQVLGDLIPTLAKAPEDGDRWIQDLQGMHLRGAVLREQMKATTGATSPASDRGAIFALAGNPAALDRRATVGLALSLLSTIAQGEGTRAWEQGPLRDLIEETKGASAYLNPVQDLMQDVIGSAGGGAGGPDDQAEARQKADREFRRLASRPNPVGRIVVGLQLSALPFLLDSLRAHAARCRMAQVALTLLDHRSGHGGLPESLPPGAPMDPFTDQPFRWDASRALLWSVGRNRIDDQGDRRKDEVLRLQAEPER